MCNMDTHGCLMHVTTVTITWPFLHTSPSLYDPQPMPDPDSLCYILVAHSAKHMSSLMCIASRTVIWLLLYFLVLSPLWFLCSMHPPRFMLPSVCLMLTFPVAPRLAPIVLRVPIRLVVVFKSLVFSYVPQFKYCYYLHYSICLTLLACLPLWVPKT